MKLLVIACTHGNEKYGLKVLNRIRGVEVLVGNQLAVKNNERFIDCDLNRCFPGKKNGNHEEKFAFELVEKLKNYDFVLDLHSCSQESELFGIITKPDKEKIEFAKKLGLKKIILMNENLAKGKALIDFCKCGISLEVGPHKREENVGEVLDIIDNFLESKIQNRNLEIFEIFSLIKADYKKSFLTNFRRVGKGDLIAIGKKKYFAEFDFIPVLANEEEYKDVLCLAARRVNLKYTKSYDEYEKTNI